MRITTDHAGRTQTLAALFEAAFAASEGDAEGALIGGVVRDLLATTPDDDLRVFRADDGGEAVAAAMFTRLTFAGDAPRVMLLSPLAVAPARQRQGIGQTLLRTALGTLRSDGAAIVMTYGDPAYYGRIGFRAVPVARVPPPHPLSMPEGWIGQMLGRGEMPTLAAPSSCAAALDRADIW